jgi:hypothetical protein
MERWEIAKPTAERTARKQNNSGGFGSLQFKEMEVSIGWVGQNCCWPSPSEARV